MTTDSAAGHPGGSINMELIKELIGSAMYFADIDEYKHLVSEKLTRETNWDRIEVVEYDPVRQCFLDKTRQGMDGLPARNFYSADSPFIRRMISSTGVFQKDLEDKDLEAYELKLLREGYRIVSLSPVLPREHLAGVVMGFSKNKESITENDGKILELAAEIIALSMQIFKENRMNTDLEEKVEDHHRQMVKLESLKIMGELTAGAAGDLNNILAVIMGYLQLFSEKYTDPKLQETFSEIKSMLNEGQETVQNLQEFKKIDTDQDFIPVSVSETINRAVSLTHSKWLDEARARSVEYKIETDVDHELYVSGNPTALLVAVILIIFKQLDGIPDGGKITIAGNRSNGQALLSFKTNLSSGPDGILTDLDPFMHRREGSNFSLNLSAADEIIRRHNGSLRQESVIGTGSFISVSLPFIIIEAVSSEPAVSTEISPPAKGRILVVEDEPVVRHLLEDMLSGENLTVTAVESGPEALKRLSSEKFDLIITDLGMPLMSGLEFTSKTREFLPDIPIIMATGWESRIDRKKLSEYKINHIVGKPFQFNKLIEVINDCIKNNQ